MVDLYVTLPHPNPLPEGEGANAEFPQDGKIVGPEARPDPGRSLLPRLHPGRRQGRRHGLRAFRARPQSRAPRRRGPLPHARRVSPTDARDRRPRAGRHHADERQLQRGADHRRAALRQAATSRRRSGPTTPPTSGWPPAAADTARSRRGPSARPRSTTSMCGKAECAPDERRRGRRPGALLGHVQQRRRARTTARWRPTRRSASRPRPRVSATSSRSSIPTPAAAPAGRRGPVHQRPHRRGRWPA